MLKTLSLWLAVSLLSSALTALAAAAPARAAAFVDLEAYVAGAPGGADLSLDVYDRAVEALSRQFTAICGDTFCEGDGGDLTPLSLTCSVQPQTKAIGQCLWAFAGRTVDVAPVTGRIRLTSHVYACDLPVHGTLPQLVAYLRDAAASETASHGPALTSLFLPGSQRTAYEALTSCF